MKNHTRLHIHLVLLHHHIHRNSAFFQFSKRVLNNNKLNAIELSALNIAKLNVGEGITPNCYIQNFGKKIHIFFYYVSFH